ncbi:MAG: phenylalanine--tRNA ligase subunit beta [Minisyncoccales bacterium]
MLFSYEWLQSFFNKKLPAPRELAELILARGFEVEKIDALDKDWVLDINILSNRSDCLSHLGMAREIGAFLGIKPNFVKFKAPKKPNSAAAKSIIAVEVRYPEACPRYAAMAVAGIKIKSSPPWMVRRLEVCGLRAINNVVDATNYAMLETGQPLHAFDWDKLAAGRGKAKKIIVRTAQARETFKTLDGKNFNLQPWMAVIADDGGARALAGIKGGKRAEIDGKTETVILESANFDAKTIRRTSRTLGLSTDASYRFEHNISPHGVLFAARRAAELIVSIGGGRIFAGAVDKRQNPETAKKIILNLPLAEKLLGAEIQTAAAKKNLEALGFSVRRGGREDLEIVPPPERGDVAVWQDIVEEIGRVGGYEKIAPQAPRAEIVPPRQNRFWRAKSAAKDLMAAAGYSEVRNHSFISEKDCRNFGIKEEKLLEIKNPVNEDLRFLRPSLLLNLLKNFCANREFDSLRQFEIGKIFDKDRRDEPAMLAGASRNDSFFDAKGALEFLAARLRIRDFSVVLPGRDKNAAAGFFDSAQSAAVMAGKKQIGSLGRLRREIADNLGIEPPVIFEIDFTRLAQNIAEEIEYRPILAHPEAVRDISVDVPLPTLSAAVADAVKEIDRLKLIERTEISGEPYVSPDGKSKNILFRFHLRSGKKTLDGKDIDAWQAGAIAAIEKNPGWRVKKIKN